MSVAKVHWWHPDLTWRISACRREGTRTTNGNWDLVTCLDCLRWKPAGDREVQP